MERAMADSLKTDFSQWPVYVPSVQWQEGIISIPFSDYVSLYDRTARDSPINAVSDEMDIDIALMREKISIMLNDDSRDLLNLYHGMRVLVSLMVMHSKTVGEDVDSEEESYS
jgi:hypothetical protein